MCVLFIVILWRVIFLESC